MGRKKKKETSSNPCLIPWIVFSLLGLFSWCLLITTLVWRDTNCTLLTMLVIMRITFWFISICQHHDEMGGVGWLRTASIVGYCLWKKNPHRAWLKCSLLKLEIRLYIKVVLWHPENGQFKINCHRWSTRLLAPFFPFTLMSQILSKSRITICSSASFQ